MTSDLNRLLLVACKHAYDSALHDHEWGPFPFPDHIVDDVVKEAGLLPTAYDRQWAIKQIEKYALSRSF